VFKHLSKTHSSMVRSSFKQSGPDHYEINCRFMQTWSLYSWSKCS